MPASGPAISAPPAGPSASAAGQGPAAGKSGLTSALKQYFEAKQVCPEAFLFFQVGDFYELFFEDALKAAPLLNLNLTSRQKLNDQPIPLCGVPLSTGETYINRLVSMGYKVAVCDQLASPQAGAGLAERAVRRVVTPGSILEADSHSAGIARYLAAVHCDQGEWAIASADLSTGDFVVGRFEDFDSFMSSLSALDPKEILVAEDASEELKAASAALGAFVSIRPVSDFNSEPAAIALQEVYGPRGLPAPLTGWPVLQGAAGAVLAYCRLLTQGAVLAHLTEPRLLEVRQFLHIDEAAVRNLELFKSQRDGDTKSTLLTQIDLTTTPMGARLLRQWLARPLLDSGEIKERHEAVGVMAQDLLGRQELVEALSQCGDLERSLSRLTLGRGTVRDLIVLRRTLSLAPKIKELLSKSSSKRFLSLSEALDPQSALNERLWVSLVDCPPTTDKDGQIVRQGLSPRLDTLRELEVGGKQQIAAMEIEERNRTSISNLKIGFTRVFGYFFEVTKSNLALVPADWSRKQTISNGERFVTNKLKEWEEKILTAGEKRQSLEERILDNLKKTAAKQAQALKALSSVMAQVDVLCALAACAEKRGWVKPELTEDDVIDIKGGRHPVVEVFLPPGETFVENDVLITPKQRLLIITGPNMAGKSTVLRQTALIVILNQMGSFVPAAKATLSIRDQLFTRVGASDDLARGQSTFMVEMSETARILKRATSRSLVILDEVGRGTSTYDGLAIAWAVAEYLHDLGGRGVPTLFATHYHELVELARHKPLTRNYNVSVKKWGESVVFLRKLAPGGVNRSYGLDVASIAGLPKQVIKRAREVLSDLGKQAPGLIRGQDQRANLINLSGLKDDGPTSLAREIQGIKTEELTPLAALNLIVELKTKALEVLS
jgi:DNA mismatch repair protein MutS